MLLNDKNMFDEWNRDVKTMAGRIIEMREALYDQLVNKLQTPGDWKHITNQIGMFSFTGLNPDQCKAMVDNAHIYMTGNGAYPEYVTPEAVLTQHTGRISMAGINTNNVEYVAQSIDKAVRGKL
jgi:aspartate aminotransferase